MNLSGKVAVVTGAGAGIGRAIALAFAGAGAKVAIVDWHQDRAELVAREATERGGNCLPVVADCSADADVERLFDITLECFGRLDILSNNALTSSRGGRGAANKSFAELTAEDWDITMTGSLRGYVICSLRAVKEMVRQGHGGKIIHMGSVAGNVALARSSAYCTAKAAVQGLTMAMALDLAPYKINVNVINPALTRTNKVMRVLPPDVLDQWLERIPLGRYAEPEDVASMALFLASPGSNFITGQAFAVDGGFLSAGII